MILDNFYVGAIGKLICQDYSFCSSDKTFPFAVLSDGCSSGGETHLASAIIARENSVVRAKQTADSLGLKFQDMLATRIQIEKDKFLMEGDGTVVVKCRNGMIEVINVKFSENAPDYPAYQMYGLEKEYLKEFKGQEKLVTTTLIGPDCNDWTNYDYPEYFHPTNQWVEDPEFIMAFSDGIESFIKDGDMEQRYPYIDFVKRMLQFKNYNPGFFKRRFNRLKEELKKDGYEPFDDVSGIMVFNGGVV